MPRNQHLCDLTDNCERLQTLNVATFLTHIRNTDLISCRILTPSTLRWWPILSLWLFCVVVFSQVAVQAQNVQRNNEAVDLGLRSNLTVNPATRGLELQIPLGNYPGRAGHDVPVTISYSSKLWNMAYQGFAPGPPPGYGYGPAPFTILMAKYGEHSVSGWNTTTGGPYIDPRPGDQLYNQFGQARGTGDCSAGCFIIDRVMAWMPDGSGHELRSSDQALNFTAQRPDNLYSVDRSRLRYQRSTNTLFLPDGSRYVMSNPGGYIDRNGNTINATDTLGRTIANPLSAPSDQPFSLPGVGVGGTINYILKWRNLADVLTTPQPLAYVANNGCPPGTGSFLSPHLFSSDIDGRTCIQNAMQLFNPVVLSQIVLPTGQSYTFTYNTYGEIDKVTLPTGGYEKYVYGGVTPLSNGSSVYTQYNRGVAQRTVSSTGSSADEVSWGYSGGGPYVKIVAPDGTWTERYVWGDGNSMWGYSSDGARAGRAYDERVYSASNQMLRRKLTEWAMTGSNGSGTPGGLQYANRNARVTRETEFILDTGGGALARTTTYGYDLTYQFDVGIDQTSVSQYDYVLVDQNTAQTIPVTSLSSIPNGTLLRTTQTAYLTGNANYRNRNIVGMPISTTVYKGSPTDNIVVAQSSISYDEGGQFAQFNDYGSVVNWTDPQTPYRGNPTTISQWLNFNGSTLSTFPNGTYLTTHARYDQCGSVRKAWDARDTALTNPSQVSYSDAFSDGVPRNTYAFPTSITTAVPDPNGAYGSNVAFTTTSVYDFNTGKVVSTTDANAKTTSYDYTDLLNRLRQVTLPNTGRVRYNYFDTPGDLYVQVLADEDSSRSIETRKYFDGLGRPTRGFLYDGTASTPWLVTDTYYDTSGRVWKVSNPYRVSSPSSSVPASCSACATSAYDALGRVISVTTPDSAQVTTSYSALTSGSILGTTVLVTDQGGKVRRSITDALGRLVRVDEPDVNGNLGDVSSPVQPTSYAYDVLGNLRQVTQGSQQRFFMYDSLSRLIRARNPEQTVNTNLNLTDSVSGNSQWCLSYAYDNNGNLTQKTDARGVVSTYAYDALNRNTTVNYSDTTSINPDITRIYDTATNGKGRLRESYAGGNETLGATVEHTKLQSYDALGRPLDQRQRFKTNSVWSAEYQTQRGYNLAGAVTSQIYPSGRSVAYSYDTAGRSSSFTGNLGEGTQTQRSYSTEIIYSPLGGMTKEKLGTDTPIYNKLFYNSRGQLAEIRESTSYTGPTDTTWNRGAIINHYSNSCWGMCGGSNSTTPMTDNNGNLKKQEVYVPLNDQVSSYTTWWQGYDYDNLNRLQRVHEYTGNTPLDWQQEYVYDRYGNRTIQQTNTWGAGINKKNFTANAANNNRLGVPGGQTGTMNYDAAGNLTTDTYTQATYAGSGSRVYDAENRMTSAQDANGVWNYYTYNADGQRVRRKINGVETWQVYGMDGELLAEYAASAAPASPQKEYGYRNGQLLITAEVTTGPPAPTFSDDFNDNSLDPVKWSVVAPTSPAVVSETGQRLQITLPPNTATYNGISSNATFDLSGKSVQVEVAQAVSQAGWCENFLQVVLDANNYYLIDVGGGSLVFRSMTGGVNNQTVISYTSSAFPYWRIRHDQAANTINFETSSNGTAWTTRKTVTAGFSLTALRFYLYAGAWGTGNGSPGAAKYDNFQLVGNTPSTVVNIQWLVADQLGTPRMIFDKTGVLANVKRHDYLPFGEELTAGQGLRTTAQGYSPDGIRQKFTSKERDNETGLDYLGARYYGSTQGRFTSPDPGNAGVDVGDPQSWNGYAYSLNNPLRYIDPDGLRWAQAPVNGGIQYQWFDDDEKDANGQTAYGRALASGWSGVTFNESGTLSFTDGLLAPGETLRTVTLSEDSPTYSVSTHTVTWGEWTKYLYLNSFSDAIFGTHHEADQLNDFVSSIVGVRTNASGNGPDVSPPALGTGPGEPGRPRDAARKRGNDLVEKFKEVGEGVGRSGGGGEKYKRAGAELIREANKLARNNPLREAMKTEGKRLINYGRGVSHK